MKHQKKHLVVTSIASPNPVLRALAKGAIDNQYYFTIIGDTKSPETFKLEGAQFLSILDQKRLDLKTPALLRERSYARKNIGYLLAMQQGAEFIIETDDDNYPRQEFWNVPELHVSGSLIRQKGWCNVYSHFTDTFIWPRGFPLELLGTNSPHSTEPFTAACPIQQGLADENPDVDAIYRMTRNLPVTFLKANPIILGSDTWCPYNSQNTIHFPPAYLLLYLPTYCSFRMTDIWRSFIAQRILWTNGWNLSFHSATVWQERNAHNLLNDFSDEVPGYLNNAKIVGLLRDLELKSNPESIPDNLWKCYDCLISNKFVDKAEILLVEAWIEDCQKVAK
jgi:hypothetical protein